MRANIAVRSDRSTNLRIVPSRKLSLGGRVGRLEQDMLEMTRLVDRMTVDFRQFANDVKLSCAAMTAAVAKLTDKISHC